MLHFIPRSLKLHMVSVRGGLVSSGSAWERDAASKRTCSKLNGNCDKFPSALTDLQEYLKEILKSVLLVAEEHFDLYGITFSVAEP